MATSFVRPGALNAEHLRDLAGRHDPERLAVYGREGAPLILLPSPGTWKQSQVGDGANHLEDWWVYKDSNLGPAD